LNRIEQGAPRREDFAVVGGGLVGRLVAWQLAGAGHDVALYERGDAAGTQSAAWVAAAMLAPLAEAASAEPLVVGLGAASLERWPRLIAQLPEPVFFQRNGTLVVWHGADRAEAPLFERRLRANSPADLLDGGFVKLAGAQVAQAEPALGTRFAQGWLLPNEGQLDNRQALSALAAGLTARGVRTYWNTPVDAMPDARWIIDCRGLGAKPAWPALRGIRGEVANRLLADGALKPEYARDIPATVTARVVPSNVFAVSSVQLVDNGKGGASLRPGAVIREDESLPTVLFQTTLNKFRQLFVALSRQPTDNGVGVLATITEATHGRGEQLR